MASNHVKDMTKGDPRRAIIAFAVPTLVSQIFQQLYSTADSLIVGRVHGTEALAAVSSSGTLIFLMTSFFIGTAIGAGVVISRYFGEGNYEKVSRAIHTNVTLGLLCGLFLTVVGVLGTPTFLRWIKTDPDVLPQSIEYFRYYFLGALSMIMYNVCRGIMNALGDSRRPLRYLIFSSVLNVLLDLLFLWGFRWGVWAAAVATVISQTASVVLCLIHLCKPGEVYSLSLSKMRISRDMLGEIIRYGLPAGVQNSVIAIANIIVQTEINSFQKYATAAYGSYSKVEGFAFLPITSFNMAVTTFVGQNMGAGEHERAKKGARFSILSSVIMAEIIGVVIYVFAPTLIAMFDREANPQVIIYGVQQARTASLFYCLLALSHSIAAVCRGAGKAFVPMFVMLGCWCLFRITYILAVMHFIHRIGMIYWAYPITWSLSSIIFVLYYKLSHWERGFGV